MKTEKTLYSSGDGQVYMSSNRRSSSVIGDPIVDSLLENLKQLMNYEEDHYVFSVVKNEQFQSLYKELASLRPFLLHSNMVHYEPR